MDAENGGARFKSECKWKSWTKNKNKIQYETKSLTSLYYYYALREHLVVSELSRRNSRAQRRIAANVYFSSISTMKNINDLF